MIVPKQVHNVVRPGYEVPSRRVAGAEPVPPRHGGGEVYPHRKKVREWHCDCDPATDVCVCQSGGLIRVLDPYPRNDPTF